MGVKCEYKYDRASAGQIGVTSVFTLTNDKKLPHPGSPDGWVIRRD